MTTEEIIIELHKRFPGFRFIGAYPLMDLPPEMIKAVAEITGKCGCASDSNHMWEIKCDLHRDKP